MNSTMVLSIEVSAGPSASTYYSPSSLPPVPPLGPSILYLHFLLSPSPPVPLLGQSVLALEYCEDTYVIGGTEYYKATRIKHRCITGFGVGHYTCGGSVMELVDVRYRGQDWHKTQGVS